jgi:hypothetical protein
MTCVDNVGSEVLTAVVMKSSNTLLATYSSTLKSESIFSSETSVGFQRTIQRYISEYRTLHE